MELLTDHKHRVLRITLNRPEKRNALTSAMCTDIVKAVRSAQNDTHVGAILIGAAGQVFCAGMDLDEAADMEEDELAEVHEDLFTMGAKSLKPIVVSVNGPALGGGFGLAAQGHIVLAAQSSVFGLPEIRIGFWPFVVYRAVEAAIGRRHTLTLSLTGHVLSAHEACHAGLVHHVCPPAETSERAEAISRELAKASPSAIAAGMQYVLGSRETSWEESGELARSLRSELIKSPDFREGYEAFKQKREPRWPSILHQSFATDEKPNSPPPSEPKGS